MASRTWRKARSSVGKLYVMVVGKKEVTPVLAWKRCIFRMASGVSSIVSAPTQPWMWTLRKPGAT